MDEVKISEQLSEKLGQEHVNKLRTLTGLENFKELLLQELETSSCSETVRENIFNKMENLTEILVKISSITKMHISNDEKRKRIEKELDNFDLKAFKRALLEEMDATDKTLKTKVKDAAKNIKTKVEDRITSLKQMFQDNMEIVADKKKEAQEKEAELKRQDKVNKGPEVEEKLTLEELEAKKEKILEAREDVKAKMNDLTSKSEKLEDEKQVALATQKSLGFVQTFWRMWGKRKDNSDKKQGFFTVLRNAYRETALNKEEFSKNDTKKDAEAIYNEQLETAEQIKKYKADYKDLSRQLKDLNKKIAGIGQDCLEECRHAYDKAIAPVDEKKVTPEKLNKLVEKVAKVGREDKAKTWIEKMTSAIDKMLAYTVDPIIDAVLGTPEDIEKELAENAQKAKAKSDLAKEKLETAEKQKTTYESLYNNLSENMDKEDRAGKKAIKGVSKACKISNSQYNRKQKKFEKAESKSIEANEKLSNYRNARNSGIDR